MNSLWCDKKALKKLGFRLTVSFRGPWDSTFMNKGVLA